MAIAELSRIRTVFGNKVVLVITGDYDSGDTTGTIATGLVAVDYAQAQYKDAAKIIGCSASGGTITLATENPGATKIWTMIVIGH
jgi:hypothetical protein